MLFRNFSNHTDIKIKFIIIFLALSSVMIASCDQTATPVAVDTQSAMGIPSHTSPTNINTVATSLPMNSILLTISPSKTPIQLTKPGLTSTLTVTPFYISDPKLSYQCIDIFQSPPPNVTIKGDLLLWEYSTGNRYLFDLNSREKTILTNSSNVILSPDRSKLAFKDYNSNKLIITDIVKNQSFTIPADTIPINLQWDSTIAWLDNENIIIEKKRFTPFEEPHKLSSLIIFNPYTKETQEFFPEDYPNIFDIPIAVEHWYLSSRFIPDPTLTRIVYQASDEKETPIVLWDIQNDAEIARIHSIGFLYGDTPRWSPDGSEFVSWGFLRYENEYGEGFVNFTDEPYVGGAELISVSIDGDLERLTFLTNTYAASPSNPSWSPDGRYIAYWLTIDGSEYHGERLAVLDTHTGQVTNYCIAGSLEWMEGHAGTPVWSPDGKYLALTIPDEEKKGQFNVLLVDLENGFAFQVVEGASVGGWMISSP